MKTKDPSSEIKFSNLETTEKLADFLRLKGKGHTNFFHYTNSDVLKGMIQSQKIYLSRADTLNDFYEGNNSKKECVYIVSFSYRSPENIAMWSMYACPYPEGIRLEFPRRAMRQVIEQFEKDKTVYSVEENNENKIIDKVSAELDLIDVAYVHKASLERDRELNKNATLFNDVKSCLQNDSALCWCIKHDIWLAEREVRLILKLERPIQYKKIAIDFSNALSSFKVTCGPCANKKNIENITSDLDNITINESAYQGKTYFKSCTGCLRQTEFCKKRKKSLDTNIFLGTRIE